MSKVDTIVIGNGLSALACGINLAKFGQRVTMIGTGGSLLTFNGGSMELLGTVDGNPVGPAVVHPLESIAQLPDNHPYRKVGIDRIASVADGAKRLLFDAGINTVGSAETNHWRITPMGVAKPAWLTLKNHLCINDLNYLPCKRVTLMCVRGFLDQPNGMLAEGLKHLGFEVEMIDFTTDDLSALRRSRSEMRAINISKHLVSNTALQRLAEQVNTLAGDTEMVLLPNVLGVDDDDAFQTLQQLAKPTVRLVATLPPSVAGARMTTLLRHYFQMLGGNLITDTVTAIKADGDTVTGIKTLKDTLEPLTADNYVLATGSFIGRGIVATHERIIEPLLDLDVDADADRELWTQFNAMEPQRCMRYGVATDDTLHCLKNGRPMANLRAVGSILSGHDAIKMGDGTGVSLITAIAAARDICGK